MASWYNTRGNASVNVNGLVPNIALERIEIVKDGASALYGSDAIAGVVNFITKKDFEGVDFSYEFTTDDETGKGDTSNFQLIFGTQGDRGGMVVAAGVLNRDEINVDDRYSRFGGSTASGVGQPGGIAPLGQVVWADHGLNPGEAPGRFPRDPMGTSYGQADVNCEDSAALEQGGPLGPVFGNVVCAYDFGSFFALQSEESLRKFHVTGHYDVTDELEIYVEFAANDAEFDRKNSLNPNALNLEIPVTNPGLTEDAWRRGIVPIPVENRTRLIGGTRYTSEERRPIDTFTDTNRSDQRMLLGGKWDIEAGGKDWSLDVSYTASEHDSATTQVQDTLSSEMLLAINGLGGPTCDHVRGTPGEGNLAYAASGGDFLAGNCYYFNPFGNSAFDRSGNQQTDLKLVNPAELYRWLAGRTTSDIQFRQRVIDVVFTGDLFDTSAGSIGLAVGFQRRRDSADAVFDAATNTNNLDFAFGAQDWHGNLTTTAYFAEIGIPIGDTLEINAAVRYEDFDEIGETTTDPKLTILWRPLDSLSIRASVGSSFRVPSLQQLFGTQTTVHNLTDIGNNTAFRPAISSGNPLLKPEEADTWNLGITYAPTDGPLSGLHIDLDYYDYDYTDIITRESHDTILADDVAALEAAIMGGMTLVEAIAAGVGNRRQVVRNGAGTMLRVLPDYLNANSAAVSGVDLNAAYSFDTNLGLFRIGLQGAWVREYEVEVPNSSGGVTVIDAVGQYNNTNPVARPLPEFKVNTSLNWSLGNHRAFLLVRHVDGYKFGTFGGAQVFWRATVGLALGSSAASKFYTNDIDSWTTADVQYTYNFPEISWVSSSSITVGVKNFTNEEPPWVPDITGYDPITHDARGRIWFIRLGGSM